MNGIVFGCLFKPSFFYDTVNIDNIDNTFNYFNFNLTHSNTFVMS